MTLGLAVICCPGRCRFRRPGDHAARSAGARPARLQRAPLRRSDSPRRATPPKRPSSPTRRPSCSRARSSERYHASDAEHRDTGDLDRAREALKIVDASKLSARDHVEFLVGLGESLYFDAVARRLQRGGGDVRAALGARRLLDAERRRETLFEWWAEALDRQAQFGPDADRKPLYTRILRRAESELARDPQSSVAVYWLAAAARGADDLERALGAAVAGWIRAGSLGPRGVTLRADLDRLVTQRDPARARATARAQRRRASALTHPQAQWEELKEEVGPGGFLP